MQISPEKSKLFLIFEAFLTPSVYKNSFLTESDYSLNLVDNFVSPVLDYLLVKIEEPFNPHVGGAFENFIQQISDYICVVCGIDDDLLDRKSLPFYDNVLYFLFEKCKLIFELSTTDDVYISFIKLYYYLILVIKFSKISRHFLFNGNFSLESPYQ